MKFRNRVIAAIVAIAGIRLVTGDNAPIDDIPANHTGNVDLTCEGEKFEIADTDGVVAKKDIVASTKIPLTPTILTLEFKQGLITGWKAMLSLDNRSEEPETISRLVSTFETTCQRSKAACAPLQNANGTYELYYSSGNGNPSASGIGLLSKDLDNFAAYWEFDGKSFGNAMTCKMR